MELKTIPFNRPYISGNELTYIEAALNSGKISGDGMFARKVHDFFEHKWHLAKVLSTTSCTDALEMAAVLIGIEQGDEVIMPSYTFVSTANAFVLRGAKIIFIDSTTGSPNMDVAQIEALITNKTKAIVPVHYAGVACDMEKIMTVAKKHKIFVVEDAAQAINSYYRNEPLGSIGDLGTFSFHETKNIQCGEGGLLCVNNSQFSGRAEVIREKGTNRSAFFRGEVDKYNWVDVGSSHLPSDILAAFLFSQLEQLDYIQSERKRIWDHYFSGLYPLMEKGYITLPSIPEYATNNAHMFYVVCNSAEDRVNVIEHLKKDGIHSVFHYLSLHASPYYEDKHDGRELPWSDHYSEKLIRLPLWVGMTKEDTSRVINSINSFFYGER